MLLYLVVGLRACCIAAVLLLVTLAAGEPPHPLLGATRDQLLNRFGEPRSQLSSGGREVWFYPRERLVLSNGVVIEVERIAADAPVKAPAPTPAPADPAPAPPPATSPAPAAGAGPSGSRAPPVRPSDSTASTTLTPPPVESKLEIKLVRPPSATTPLSVNPVPPGSLRDPPISPSVSPENAPPAPIVSAPVVIAAEAASGAVETVVKPPTAAAEPVPVANTSSTVAPDPVRKTAPPPSPAPASAPSPSIPSTAPGSFGTGTLIIAGIFVLGVIGLLIWRSRQKQMELAATSVENTPLASTLAANGRFTPEFLSQLDRGRFEVLVAEYYSKTGVIAVRTNAAPGSPVHVQISWKGESRPFALVQCIPQPSAPVEAKPLQELSMALKAEGIRRGYVVTSGSFIPAARMFAEEAHLTLLSGEALVEKLNALPDSARAELAQVIAVRDPNASR